VADIAGVIAAVTTITALAGLVVAVKQTGWFDSKSSPAVSAASKPTSLTPRPPAVNPPVREPAASGGARAPASSRSVRLPTMREYRLGSGGEATITLLQVEVTPRTTEKDGLRIRMRMVNRGRYDTNFWDRSFRLMVDGVPLAPEGGLNELVPAESAKDGDVIFVVPHGTAAATLKITFQEDSTEVPLDLTSSG
jgi:hypothetical protein